MKARVILDNIGDYEPIRFYDCDTGECLYSGPAGSAPFWVWRNDVKLFTNEHYTPEVYVVLDEIAIKAKQRAERFKARAMEKGGVR